MICPRCKGATWEHTIPVIQLTGWTCLACQISWCLNPYTGTYYQVILRVPEGCLMVWEDVPV